MTDYDPKNGQPKVTVSNSGDKFLATLSIFEQDLNPTTAAPATQLRQTAAFLLDADPCTDTESGDPCGNLNLAWFAEETEIDQRLKKIVSSSITTFDANGLPTEAFQWKPDELGEVYPPLNGDPTVTGSGWKWEKLSSVLARQDAGVARCQSDAVTENDQQGVATTLFYGGVNCHPLGSVVNSRRFSAALLTGEEDIRAENCTAVGDCLGAFGRWERGGAAVQSLVAHTGEKSLKVTGQFGPTINLKIREAAGFLERGKGFLVSAWILAEPGSNPAFHVEFRRNTAPPAMDPQRDPVMHDINLVGEYPGTFPTNRWVKLQRLVTYQELSGHGVFGTLPSHDYLRIWAGKSVAAGGAVYVDDVRLHPADAHFTTRNIDVTGLLTSQLDGQNEPIFLEYDAFRSVIGSRRKNGIVDASATVKLFNE